MSDRIEKFCFFVVEKIFWKKNWNVFWKFFKIEKSKNVLKIFWTFFRIWKFTFFLSKKIYFFSKIFFDHKKLKFFDEIFLKFISCVRKVVLKWFQNDSDSLKIRKIKDQKYWSEIKGSVVIRAVALGCTIDIVPVGGGPWLFRNPTKALRQIFRSKLSEKCFPLKICFY